MPQANEWLVYHTKVCGSVLATPSVEQAKEIVISFSYSLINISK
jgi:hypothetical protein